MGAFAKAWKTLKALPEQQQYTNLAYRHPPFEKVTPQHRVGTVHPAIRQMLYRLQNNIGDGIFLDEDKGPSLRTTGTSDFFPHNHQYPANTPLEGMIQAHPGRTGLPWNFSNEDYGQSPQFLTSMPSYQGIPNYEKGIVEGRPESQTPKGSPQAMIDQLYQKDPDAAARMFGTQ